MLNPWGLKGYRSLPFFVIINTVQSEILNDLKGLEVGLLGLENVK